MPEYPVTIRRCQHIKANGTQCGSPAKRKEMHCFFHEQCRLMSRKINMRFKEHGVIQLPTLEDANSIQLGLAEVMMMLVTQQIDPKIAALLLRILRTASSNLKNLSVEPKDLTQIVIDPNCVKYRPLGATAWSTVKGREFDFINDPLADPNQFPASWQNAQENDTKNGKNDTESVTKATPAEPASASPAEAPTTPEPGAHEYPDDLEPIYRRLQTNVFELEGPGKHIAAAEIRMDRLYFGIPTPESEIQAIAAGAVIEKDQ